jgi:hypothetical protein
MNSPDEQEYIQTVSFLYLDSADNFVTTRNVERVKTALQYTWSILLYHEICIASILHGLYILSRMPGVW